MTISENEDINQYNKTIYTMGVKCMPNLTTAGEADDDNFFFTSQITATPRSHWHAKSKNNTTTTRPVRNIIWKNFTFSF